MQAEKFKVNVTAKRKENLKSPQYMVKNKKK